MRRSRLVAFLRRWPELVRTSTWSDGTALEVHPVDDFADGLGAHAGPEDEAGLGAGAVLLVELAELHLADGHERLEGLDLVAGLCGAPP